MKRLICSILAVIISGSVYAKDLMHGYVKKVIDGDTVDVEFVDKTVTRVRFAFVDTPERGQGGFQEATNHVRQSTIGKEVAIQIVSDGRYGRAGSIVYVDDKNLNLDLVARGLGVLDPAHCNESQVEYWTVQNQAKQENHGVWSQSDFVEPRIFRWNQKFGSREEYEAKLKSQAPYRQSTNAKKTLHKKGCYWSYFKNCTIELYSLDDAKHYRRCGHCFQ